MSRLKPYLPLWLRILHNSHAVLILAAIVTGFWVYDTYDGRFGKLSLPPIPDLIGIHGTFGLTFFLLLPVFALYAFHAGKQRLWQPESLGQLTQVGQPIWWFSLHRLVNTTLLLAAVFAAISGRMMKEEWLPAKEFYHLAYSAHLIAWATMVVTLACHLLMVIKVGGVPLLLAMVNWKFRPEDSPTHWPDRVQNWLQQLRSSHKG